MKHLKNSKSKEPISKTKIAIICVVCALLAFGITLAVLLVLRGNLGYEEARNYADEILKTKDSVSVFLDAEVDDLELDAETKTKVDTFEKATEKVSQYMESLSASSALKNKEVAEKYEKAKADFEKLEKVAKTEKDLMSLFEDGLFTEEKLNNLSNSENDFIKKMAEDITGYKKEAKEFVEKYGDVSKVDEEAMVTDYGDFQIKGEGLLDDYSEVGFNDLFGYSKDDVLKFYASIEELVSILNEKI